jgi:hypothetical protein
MIYFPETINTISTTNTILPMHSLVSSWLYTLLTLCMLASQSHEGAVFLDLLSSSHPITSSLFPYLGSTDAPCSRFGDPVPPSPKWRPHSQGPRILPYRDPEQWEITGELYMKWFMRDSYQPARESLDIPQFTQKKVGLLKRKLVPLQQVEKKPGAYSIMEILGFL